MAVEGKVAVSGAWYVTLATGSSSKQPSGDTARSAVSERRSRTIPPAVPVAPFDDAAAAAAAAEAAAAAPREAMALLLQPWGAPMDVARRGLSRLRRSGTHSPALIDSDHRPSRVRGLEAPYKVLGESYGDGLAQAEPRMLVVVVGAGKVSSLSNASAAVVK